MTLPPSPNPLPTTEGDGWLLENTAREVPEWLCFAKPELPKDHANPRMWMEMTTDANKAFRLSSKGDAVTLKALINMGHAKWLEPTHHKWISAPTTEGVTQGWPVPDGWKLVPIEPTEEMEIASKITIDIATKKVKRVTVWGANVWAEILAAAPLPPPPGP